MTDKSPVTLADAIKDAEKALATMAQVYAAEQTPEVLNALAQMQNAIMQIRNVRR